MRRAGGGWVAAVAAVAAVSIMGWRGGSVSAGPTTRPSQLAERREYACPRVEAAPVIDGVADEGEWGKSGWTEEFVRIRGDGAAALRTRAKMAWDGRCLYVLAEMEEPHVRAERAEHDAHLYLKDGVFELFIDPDGDGRDYCELQVNARGTVMDLLMNRPYRDRGTFDMKWEARGMQVAVGVRGTVNEASDRDEGWVVEMAIPWEALAGIAHRTCPPAEGDQWRVNLARAVQPVRVVGGKYETPKRGTTQYAAWSPQGEVNLHAPEKWGVVRFGN